MNSWAKEWLMAFNASKTTKIPTNLPPLFQTTFLSMNLMNILTLVSLSAVTCPGYM